MVLLNFILRSINTSVTTTDEDVGGDDDDETNEDGQIKNQTCFKIFL